MKSKREVILRVIFCISLPFLTMVLSTRSSNIELAISCIYALIIAICLSFKLFKDMYKNIDGKVLLGAIGLSLYFERIFMKHINPIDNLVKRFIHMVLSVNIKSEYVIMLLVLASLPSIITLIYMALKWLIPKLKKIYKEATKVEKKTIILLLILGFATSFIIYNKTNIYYSPRNGTILDVIYTTDSGLLFMGDAYLNFSMCENDIRQPLFGLFAAPFAIVAYILSDLLFFVPNGYAVFLNTIQITLLGISVLMIARMLKLDERDKKLYVLFCFATFPFMLFSFVMEQYIFAVFYLILTIYLGYYGLTKINYSYIGAVGTMLTSGVIFPLISKFKSLKEWLLDVLNCFIVFCCVVITFGQMSVFTNAITNIERLMEFTGKKVLLMDRVKQYLYFARSIFIAPAVSDIPNKMVYPDGEFPLYHMREVSFISITGIVILALCLISAIINRKNKLAKISILWIIFSSLILCLVGWGTAENGLVLYTLYFSWAFIVLIYLLIDKLIKNNKIKTGVIVGICLILVVLNAPEFINILKFGIEYYPA